MITSKLPHVGTTIFTTMSQLAAQYDAINLSQGFPEFDGPEFLKERLNHYINSGQNQYAPMPGTPQLRESIKQLIKNSYEVDSDKDSEITVTSGATEAIFVAIQTLVEPGDEVIIFDPAYDSYEPSIRLAGGMPVHIELCAPNFTVDWEVVQNHINDKTKLIIINSPHNPTGTCLSADDMNKLQRLVCDHELFCISDEVYEHLVFEDQVHQSVHLYPELKQRSFIVSSFGKTFHMTGWKMGYCWAPEYLTKEFRKIHQFVVFSSFTPAQLALSDMINQHPEHCSELRPFYQSKRDQFLLAMKASRFKCQTPSGTYFVVADYSDISSVGDDEFCQWMTKEHGIAAIPMSVFYKNRTDNRLIRFCFAKTPNTIKTATDRLVTL